MEQAVFLKCSQPESRGRECRPTPKHDGRELAQWRIARFTSAAKLRPLEESSFTAAMDCTRGGAMHGASAPQRGPKSASKLPATPIVFVVDDDISVRESLELLIRWAGWQPETFASAQEFLARARPLAPSCLVLDVGLPDLNGLDLQKRVAADRLDMPIIFITGCGDVPMTVQAMKAGAVEFLTKPFGDDVLLAAVGHAIARSERALAQAAELRTVRDKHASLSPREREVMTLVVAGRLNKQIGDELGISEITVKAHRGRVMRKMHADSLADLVRMDARLSLAAAPAI
jgi:FixJ family two-component response regulator